MTIRLPTTVNNKELYLIHFRLKVEKQREEFYTHFVYLFKDSKALSNMNKLCCVDLSSSVAFFFSFNDCYACVRKRVFSQNRIYCVTSYIRYKKILFFKLKTAMALIRLKFTFITDCCENIELCLLTRC